MATMATHSSDSLTSSAHNADTGKSASIGLAVLRITLGVIILVTWWGNIADDLYTSDGLTGFFNWLFTSGDDGGNGSTLSFYNTLANNTLLKAGGLFGTLQLVIEGLVGLALLLGAFTRAAALAAVIFFFNLFLAYFGGNEWIWTYVILGASSLAVFLGYAGRTFGLDNFLVHRFGHSPADLLW